MFFPLASFYCPQICNLSFPPSLCARAGALVCVCVCILWASNCSVSQLWWSLSLIVKLPHRVSGLFFGFCFIALASASVLLSFLILYSFDLHLQWMVCTGCEVDRFVTMFLRKAKQCGLAMMQLQNDTSHPFNPPIFIPLHQSLQSIRQVTIWSVCIQLSGGERAPKEEEGEEIDDRRSVRGKR